MMCAKEVRQTYMVDIINIITFTLNIDLLVKGKMYKINIRLNMK